MLMVYVSIVVIGINMKLIDKVKKGLKKVKEFVKRHAIILFFIVGTTCWVCFFPRMDPLDMPQLALLLVVAFLLATMRDHEVWWRQRVKLEEELKLLQGKKKK
jgi:hypothetical protein